MLNCARRVARIFLKKGSKIAVYGWTTALPIVWETRPLQLAWSLVTAGSSILRENDFILVALSVWSVILPSGEYVQIHLVVFYYWQGESLANSRLSISSRDVWLPSFLLESLHISYDKDDYCIFSTEGLLWEWN